MKMHNFGQLAAAVAIALAIPAVAADAPASDGLTKVKSKKLDKAYVMTGADFTPYTAILFDPVEATFAKNWQRDYNSDTSDLSRRISDADAAEILGKVQAGIAKTFAETFEKAGYRIADRPGRGVLKVGAVVSDVRVSAPDIQSAGRSRSYAQDAGSASLTLEARDSSTGKLLARAIDSTDIGDHGRMMWQRNSVTNQADFERAFTNWAKAGVKALDALKATATTTASK